MKFQTKLSVLLALVLLTNCGNSVDYSEDFKNDVAGKYLYNPDDLIKVYFNDNTLMLNWRGANIEPVALDENEIFIADMYAKYRFLMHPETGQRYMSQIPENNPDSLRYDYLKVSDDFKTPSQYLKAKNFEKALEGYLAIKAQDSTSDLISERDFNRQGYRYFRDQDWAKAIEVFKMNVALHPNSSNVYDSLAQAYLVSGDSINAYENYSKALEKNSSNNRARTYIEEYEAKRKD
ncbi:tetratricopeptide repeat protein [Winogradskyella maritima]|uniref:Tetratricopeptide repeat protein n=1 Tax=Winogradskyella maritima TaxID=1517766 RepID=A0ABV8AHY9_9FLAO|nr:tetratricopeptide repeat protein [Winogradskyella maritima]